MDTAEPKNAVTLNFAAQGECFKVCSFKSELSKSKRRLEAIGMTPGAHLCVLAKKSKGTLIVRLRSCKWALGKELTRYIEVVPVPSDVYARLESERV